MKPGRGVRSCIFLLAALLAPHEVLAQGGPLSFEFRFSNPGARSLAFGGAFVALADDATAVFSNPAGLVQLVRSEVSIEGRRSSSTTRFTAGGRLSGDPTGIGLDDVRGLRFDESSTVLSGLSFFPLCRLCTALQNLIKSDQVQVPASSSSVSLRRIPKPERSSPQA